MRVAARLVRDKIADGNLAAYKELSEAYRVEGKQDEAIAAGEKYVTARPKDYEFMRALAGDYELKASTLRNGAAAVQADLTAKTGGTTFSLPPNSLLGRALGSGRIDQELTSAANQKLTEAYTGIQTSSTRATRLYQAIAAVRRDDVLLQLLLANAAYQAQLIPVAVKAYARVIKLAPDSAEAQQASDAIRQLRAQAQASGVPAR